MLFLYNLSRADLVGADLWMPGWRVLHSKGFLSCQCVLSETSSFLEQPDVEQPVMRFWRTHSYVYMYMSFVY
jgi:hypothetical protein